MVQLGIRVMVFCKDHLFLGVGTAYGGTITVAALKNLSGADTLYPGDVMGMFLVRKDAGFLLHMALWRTGAVQSPDW